MAADQIARYAELTTEGILQIRHGEFRRAVDSFEEATFEGEFHGTFAVLGAAHHGRSKGPITDGDRCTLVESFGRPRKDFPPIGLEGAK